MSQDPIREEQEEPGPGGMDAIPDEPLDDSEDPGGMSGIPEADPPRHDRQEQES
jgi:hypothetical protein